MNEPEALEVDDGGASVGDGEASLVAIVGRPNVGKSTLFNRLVGARLAIVEDKPGVTRDRLYGAASWMEHHFLVVDTGGLEPGSDEGLPVHIRAQADVAVDEADLILFVVDACEGATPVDHEIAEILRRSGKPVLVVANKADNPRRELDAVALHELGVGPVHAVSAAHGRGVGELCDALVAALPHTSPERLAAIPPGTRIAFIGRPNAGKSTLVNTLLKEPRVIVDEEPGTTRDPVYLPFHYKTHALVLTDTAGLRRRKQVARAMEKLAAIKSIRAMERTQVVVLVVDAEDGVTDQDQRIARMSHERGKGVVVALHKWDLVHADVARARALVEATEETLSFLGHPFIIKTSVVGDGRDEGRGRAQNLDRLLDACLATARALTRRIPTAALNQELAAAIAEHSPPTYRAGPVRLYFATQAESEPPLIVISANKGRCLSTAYERYLLKRLRNRWDLRGVPIRLVVRARGKGNDQRK